MPTARAFANADPLNRRVVDQLLIGVATRVGADPLNRRVVDQLLINTQAALQELVVASGLKVLEVWNRSAPTSPRGARARVRSVDALSRRPGRSWMRGGRRRSTRWTWWGC